MIGLCESVTSEIVRGPKKEKENHGLFVTRFIDLCLLPFALNTQFIPSHFDPVDRTGKKNERTRKVEEV